MNTAVQTHPSPNSALDDATASDGVDKLINEILDDFAGGVASDGRTAYSMSAGSAEIGDLVSDGVDHSMEGEAEQGAPDMEVSLDLELGDEEMAQMQDELEAMMEEIGDLEFLSELGINITKADLESLKSIKSHRQAHSMLMMSMLVVLQKAIMVKQGLSKPGDVFTKADAAFAKIVKSITKETTAAGMAAALTRATPALTKVSSQMLAESASLQPQLLAMVLTNPAIQKQLQTPEGQKFVQQLTAMIQKINPALAEQFEKALAEKDVKGLTEIFKALPKDVFKAILKETMQAKIGGQPLVPEKLAQAVSKMIARQDLPVVARSVEKAVQTVEAVKAHAQVRDAAKKVETVITNNPAAGTQLAAKVSQTNPTMGQKIADALATGQRTAAAVLISGAIAQASAPAQASVEAPAPQHQAATPAPATITATPVAQEQSHTAAEIAPQASAPAAQNASEIQNKAEPAAYQQDNNAPAPADHSGQISNDGGPAPAVEAASPTHDSYEAPAPEDLKKTVEAVKKANDAGGPSVDVKQADGSVSSYQSAAAAQTIGMNDVLEGEKITKTAARKMNLSFLAKCSGMLKQR